MPLYSWSRALPPVKSVNKALYDAKGRRIIGYIGGGCIENRVAATAQEAITEGEPKTVNIDLDSDEMGMGIPCGGYMSVIVEPQLKIPTLLVRGVGRAVEVLCQMAHTLNFKVVVQTPEEEVERYPDVDKIITDPLEMDDIDFDVNYFVLATQSSGRRQNLMRGPYAGHPIRSGGGQWEKNRHHH